MSQTSRADGALSPAVDTAPVVENLAALDINEAGAQTEVPPHRSHDPAKNWKRTDPFQFGSRFLAEGDDPFEFNAWDHVETDDAYKEYTEQQLEKQRQAPVSDFDKSKSLRLVYIRITWYYDDTQSQCIVHLKLMMKTLPSRLSLPSDLPSTLLLATLIHWRVSVANAAFRKVQLGSRQMVEHVL